VALPRSTSDMKELSLSLFLSSMALSLTLSHGECLCVSSNDLANEIQREGHSPREKEKVSLSISLLL